MEEIEATTTGVPKQLVPADLHDYNRQWAKYFKLNGDNFEGNHETFSEDL